MNNQEKIAYINNDSLQGNTNNQTYKKESPVKPSWYDTSNFKSVKFPAGTRKKNDDIDN